jgi:hypothetical protein
MGGVLYHHSIKYSRSWLQVCENEAVYTYDLTNGGGHNGEAPPHAYGELQR